jgi:hypothetical protein
MTELEKFLENSFADCRQDQWPRLKAGGYLAQFSLRDKMLEGYCFAVLTKEMVNKIKPYGPILEVGAGTGYWAYEFKKRGVDYLATDAYPDRENRYFVGIKAWSVVEKRPAIEAVRCYPDRTLLMSWPEYSEPWAVEALKEYKGDIFIYVGEEEGGCCADDDFFEHLGNYWDEREQLDMPQFFGLHDVAIVYERIIPKMNSRYDLLKGSDRESV